VTIAGICRLPPTKSSADIKFTLTESSTTVNVGTLIKVENSDNTFILDSTVPLVVNNEETLPFICTEYGQNVAIANTINTLITSVNNCTSVTNVNDALIGTNQETDDQLRTRFQTLRSAVGYCRFLAMLARIQQDVHGVVSVAIIQNVTGIVDSNGLPPHSFMVSVDCPSTVEQAVAQKIWDVKPLGIGTYGTSSKQVIDVKGDIQTVHYSKVTTLYVALQYTVQLSTEVAPPSDWRDKIKIAIMNYVFGWRAGNDLLIQAFYGPAFSVPGVALVTVLQIGTCNTIGGPYTWVIDNVPLSISQIPSFSLDRITITEA
jgi:hypothetical protein